MSHVTKFYQELLKIQNIKKCQTCECLWETLKLFDNELKDMKGHEIEEVNTQLIDWWKTYPKLKIHSCLGCKPCLAADAYNRFRKLNIKR